MICCRKLKPMVHKNKIIGFFLLIFLGWVYQLKAQSECVLYRDTLYLVTLREQQHVSKPYEVRLEPNTGQVWVKGINSFFIDSSNYENMVRSLYSNSVFGYELYFDFFHEGNYCKDYYPPVKIDTIIENYENQQDSLSQTLYFTRYQLMLHDTEYYNRDFNDTVIANVLVDVYVNKLIIDYFIVPIKPIRTSTTDLEYKSLPYDLSYRYLVKRIVKILPLNERDVLQFR